MKISMYASLFVLVSIFSLNAKAIPPVPPTSAKEKASKIITCKDLNQLTIEEIEELNSEPEKIVSVDLELREVCFK